MVWDGELTLQLPAGPELGAQKQHLQSAFDNASSAAAPRHTGEV